MGEIGTIKEKISTGPTVDPELARIDQVICKEIDELTAENNRIWTSPDHDRREYVHSFFQYPAMMVPVVQKRLIEIITAKKPGIRTVLDPFMGSGTSLVACMENSLDCYGQDINPLAVLVARARTGPFYLVAIENRKDELFQRIEKDRSNRIEADFCGLNKWFNQVVIVELSRLVRAIRQERRLAIRRFYWGDPGRDCKSLLLTTELRHLSCTCEQKLKLHKGGSHLSNILNGILKIAWLISRRMLSC